MINTVGGGEPLRCHSAHGESGGDRCSGRPPTSARSAGAGAAAGSATAAAGAGAAAAAGAPAGGTGRGGAGGHDPAGGPPLPGGHSAEEQEKSGPPAGRGDAPGAASPPVRVERDGQVADIMHAMGDVGRAAGTVGTVGGGGAGAER